MDRLSQLKADKAPVLVTTTPEEQILEHQSNMETLWRKVSDNLFNVKEVISKLNQLKKDLSEKLFTRRLGANVITVADNTIIMSEDGITLNGKGVGMYNVTPPSIQPTHITDAVYAAGATPTKAEYDALVTKVNTLLDRLESFGMSATS